MATWPANGDTDWNTAMLAYLAVGHHTDGTHNEAGMVRQVVNYQTGAVATGTTTIPFDDTIPQKTEGDEYMTLAITPKSATNSLKIDVVLQCSCNQGYDITLALFQDATANALAATAQREPAAAQSNISLTHYMTSGTTSETTFKVRAGASAAATLTLNGAAAARKLGGVFRSSITITEIQV